MSIINDIEKANQVANELGISIDDVMDILAHAPQQPQHTGRDLFDTAAIDSIRAAKAAEGFDFAADAAAVDAEYQIIQDAQRKYGPGARRSRKGRR